MKFWEEFLESELFAELIVIALIGAMIYAFTFFGGVLP